MNRTSYVLFGFPHKFLLLFFKSYFSVTEMLLKLALRQYKYFINFVYRLI